MQGLIVFIYVDINDSMMCRHCAQMILYTLCAQRLRNTLHVHNAYATLYITTSVRVHALISFQKSNKNDYIAPC